MLPWLHLQNFHFSESSMDVFLIQENYFCKSSFAEFLKIEKFRETIDSEIDKWYLSRYLY